MKSKKTKKPTEKTEQHDSTPAVAVRCAYTRMVEIDKVKPNPRNCNRHPDAQVALLAKNIQKLGWRHPVIVSNLSGLVVAGHARLEAARKLGVGNVPVDYQDFATSEDETAYLIADNRIAELAEMDEGALGELLKELDAAGADMDLTGYSLDALNELVGTEQTEGDAEPQLDKAEELNKEWKVKKGDVWTVGRHRLMCGDSTSAEDVGKLLDGAKATLVHADPPYGMGKEKEGVQNDNLYADKLDAFQMAWWSACRKFVADNGSAYIWGNAADLWRLWFVGGLMKSERLTFRNEIVWDKGGGGFGIGTESQRCYFPEERCLFFMLGEQGFNNNADNYRDGWESVRSYLSGEMEKCGGAKNWAKALGNQMGKHYFSKSQWCFPTKEAYQKLQEFAKGDAFKRDYDELKRDYDELKRDFYSTRAHFDNTHDNMTDVWSFSRVQGEDRHGHATPKPVEMIARCIKSSAPDGSIVLEPFLGSGTTMVAAENTGRTCMGIEISPNYCAVILQRMKDAFPSIEIKRA